MTMQIQGANRDLAVALLRRGEGSVEARVARLGVEMQRTGDLPNILNLDRAVFDERFTPDSPNATPEERKANAERRREARADRERVLLLAAQTYAGGAGSRLPLSTSRRSCEPTTVPIRRRSLQRVTL